MIYRGGVTTDRIRWMPDEQMVASVLAGSGRKMAQLNSSDRSWVVAGLTLAGLTAEDIADRLDCSLRLVRSIRAEDMTQVCVHMQTETTNFTNELRLARTEIKNQASVIATLEIDLGRTKAKLDRMIDAHIVGSKVCGRCSSAMIGYNLYIHKPTGKEFCRECHRRRQQSYRDANLFQVVLPKVVTF